MRASGRASSRVAPMLRADELAEAFTLEYGGRIERVHVDIAVVTYSPTEPVAAFVHLCVLYAPVGNLRGLFHRIASTRTRTVFSFFYRRVCVVLFFFSLCSLYAHPRNRPLYLPWSRMWFSFVRVFFFRSAMQCATTWSVASASHVHDDICDCVCVLTFVEHSVGLFYEPDYLQAHRRCVWSSGNGKVKAFMAPAKGAVGSSYYHPQSTRMHGNLLLLCSIIYYAFLCTNFLWRQLVIGHCSLGSTTQRIMELLL